jgi:hypothetical protein
MSVDYGFLILLSVILMSMLTYSKVLRAIVFDTIQHPFQKSRIEIRDGQVIVKRLVALAFILFNS